MSTIRCVCAICRAHDEILARKAEEGGLQIPPGSVFTGDATTLAADEHAKRRAEKVDRFVERYGRAREIEKIKETSPEVTKATVEKLRRAFPELAEYMDKAKAEAAPRVVDPPTPPDRVFHHVLKGTYEPPTGWMVVSVHPMDANRYTDGTSEIDTVIHLRWKGAR